MKYLIRYSTSKRAELLEFDVSSISEFEQSEFIRDIRDCIEDGCDVVGNSFSLPVTEELKASYNRLQNKYWKEYDPINDAVMLVRGADIGAMLTIVFNVDWMGEYEHKIRKPLLESYGDGSEKMVLEDILKVIDPHIPPMLFRLFPCEVYSIESLLDDTTGVTSSITFNDPFDTMPMLDGDFLRQKVKQWWKRELDLVYEVWKDNSKVDEYFYTSKEAKQKIVENIKQIESEKYFLDRITNEEFAVNESLAETLSVHYQTLRDVQKHTYVACFTEKVDNVLMWSHYARCHSGFAVGYDFRLPENQVAKAIWQFVSYLFGPQINHRKNNND